MSQPITIHVRPLHTDDYSQVLALAPRLTEWVAAWREPEAVLAAVQGWVRDSLSTAAEPGHAVYVAVADDTIVGVVTVCERTHFTGQVDAYIGELAVALGMERRGIATRLVGEAEAWAAERGRSFLTLETGAANQPARRLYTALGYREEDVRLTKPLRPRT
jgi:ribosomal protein S18 acetylase RimI-like enzyme